MEEQPAMPKGVCKSCTIQTIAAVKFSQLCNASKKLWEDAADYISQIADPAENDKVFYIFYNSDKRLIQDQTEGIQSKELAIQKLNSKFWINTKKKHTRVKTTNGVVLCECPDCGKGFSDPAFMNRHLLNTEKRMCTQCCVVLPKTKLAQHLAAEHSKNVHVCNICHKLFNSLESLLPHSIKHESDSYPCSVCGNSFSTERAISAHMYAHSLFHCRRCNLSFENRKCYKYHQKQCTFPKYELDNYDQYICDHCGSSYTKKPSLRIHIVQKHLNVLPYICQICGKRTSTVAHLKSHESVHMSVRKIYQCYCGAKFRTELGYHLHQRIHTGERPYECCDCGEKFLSASRRLDHIKRRHRSIMDMPHGCDKCPARFVRPFELRKHYLSVHFTRVDVMPATRGSRRKR